jgi:cytochrome oxidase Cu insertion factor (SCO1/SenC/PrrC family)
VFGVTPTARNRLKLIAIGAIAVMPVLGSYLLYWFWTPDKHMNYGELIEPRSLPDTALSTYSDEVFRFAELRGRWVMITIDTGRCDQPCQQKLWQMRQVRQAQGKETGRIERVWLIDDEHAPSDQVLRDYRGTRVVRASTLRLEAIFPADMSSRAHVYLIDPLGNVMLRFPADADPRRMIKDLGRLLKYSRSG